MRDLREEAAALPDLLPLLAELVEAPPEIAHALRAFALTPEQLEAAIARRGLEELYRTERWLPRFDGRVVEQRSERIARTERAWLDENAAVIRAEVRRRFREHVQLTSVSATQLDADGKLLKKRYSAGRRELEHEFGKTMRYKFHPRSRGGRSGARRARPEADLAHEPAQRLRHPPARSRALRCGHLRRSEPDPG